MIDTLSIYCHAFMQAQARTTEVVADTLNFIKGCLTQKWPRKMAQSGFLKREKSTNLITQRFVGKKTGADNGNRIKLFNSRILLISL